MGNVTAVCKSDAAQPAPSQLTLKASDFNQHYNGAVAEEVSDEPGAPPKRGKAKKQKGKRAKKSKRRQSEAAPSTEEDDSEQEPSAVESELPQQSDSDSDSQEESISQRKASSSKRKKKAKQLQEELRLKKSSKKKMKKKRQPVSDSDSSDSSDSEVEEQEQEEEHKESEEEISDDEEQQSKSKSRKSKAAKKSKGKNKKLKDVPPSLRRSCNAVVVGGPEAQTARNCFRCQKPESEDTYLYRCKGCNKRLYCGRECQVAHWIQTHSEVCADLKANDDIEELEQKKRTVNPLQVLREGKNFTKHGKRGKPHRVSVFLAESGKLHWCAVGQKKEDKSKCVELSAGARVEAGKATPVFAADKQTDQETCFSIVTDKRSLDLVAETQGQRDVWVASLRYAIHKQKKAASTSA